MSLKKNKNKKALSSKWQKLTPQKKPIYFYLEKASAKIHLFVSLSFSYFFLVIQFLGLQFFAFVSWVWKKTSFSWLFLQVGRVGFYLFFKYASASGVVLWTAATGATEAILAFPLFFYFILPHKFTKKYFGLSWGSGLLKVLIGFTGWLVFFCSSWTPLVTFLGFIMVFVKVANLLSAINRVKFIRKVASGLIFVLTRVGYFFNEWVLTTNHRRLAILYFGFIILTGFVGLILATIIRLELAYPGQSFLTQNAEKYLTLISVHGIVMVFFVVIPLIFGAFANFLLPTQLGVRDVAFPRLNSFMFWLTPSGFVLLIHIILFDRSYSVVQWLNYGELKAQLRRRSMAPQSTDIRFAEAVADTSLAWRFATSSQEKLDTRGILLHESAPSFNGFSSYLTAVSFRGVFDRFVDFFVSKIIFFLTELNHLVWGSEPTHVQFSSKLGGSSWSLWKMRGQEIYSVLSDVWSGFWSINKNFLPWSFPQFIRVFTDAIINDYLIMKEVFSCFYGSYINFYSWLTALWVFLCSDSLPFFLFELGQIVRGVTMLVKNLYSSFIFFMIEGPLASPELRLAIDWALNWAHNCVVEYAYYQRAFGSYGLGVYPYMGEVVALTPFKVWLLELYINFCSQHWPHGLRYFWDLALSLHRPMFIWENLFEAGSARAHVSALIWKLYGGEFIAGLFQLKESPMEGALESFRLRYGLVVEFLADIEFAEVAGGRIKGYEDLLDCCNRSEVFWQDLLRSMDSASLRRPSMLFKILSALNPLQGGVLFDPLAWAFIQGVIHNTPQALSLVQGWAQSFLQGFLQVLSLAQGCAQGFLQDLNLVQQSFLQALSLVQGWAKSFDSFFADLTAPWWIPLELKSIRFVGALAGFIIELHLRYVVNEIENFKSLMGGLYKLGSFYVASEFKNLENLRWLFRAICSFFLNFKPWVLDSRVPCRVDDAEKEIYISDLVSSSFWGLEQPVVFPSLFSSVEGSCVLKDPFTWSVDQSACLFESIDLARMSLGGMFAGSSNYSGQFGFTAPQLPTRLASFLDTDVMQDWRLLKLEREVWRTVDMLTLARQSAFYRKKFYSNFYDPASLISKVSIWLPNQLIPGWAFITPYTTRLKYSTVGKVDLALVVVFVASLGSVFSSVNYVITYRYLGAPSLKNRREVRSFFVDALLVGSRMMLLANPALLVGILLLLSDRHFNTSVFDFSGGGDTVLFQHLFWFFGHPEVYIIIIPCFGFMNSLLPHYLRKRLSGRLSLQFSMYTIAFMGFAVWGHHLYMVGLANSVRTLYSTMTVMISVPASTKVLHWCVTLIQSTFCTDVGFLFLLAFMYFFVLGGLSGMFVAHIGFDTIFHDTFYVIGHFHVMLAGAAMSCLFAAFYFYFPTIFGVRYSRFFAYAHFIFYVSGQLLTLIPMFWLGYAGMPRRIMDYPSVFGGWHSVISSGHILTFLGLVFFILMLFDSFYESRTPVQRHYGVNRLNTRLGFYFYEARKLHAYRLKSLPLLRGNFSVNSKKDVYFFGAKAELSCFVYTFSHK